MDVVVVGNVVTPIAVGRRMHWREPDRIDTKRLDVVELGDQAAKVAVPVAIAVAKGADIDLINDRAFPPRRSHIQMSFSLSMMRETIPYSLAACAPIQ